MVFAAGDVATTRHLVTGKDGYFPLATGSNKSGRTAGENAAGKRTVYGGIVGTEVVNQIIKFPDISAKIEGHPAR